MEPPKCVKYKFVQLHKQKGSGSWNYFSFDNDQTWDTIVKFRDDQRIYFPNNKIIKILKKMFDEYELLVRDYDPEIKQIAFSDYRDPEFDEDFYLSGVVVYLLLLGYTIPLTFLKKSLVHLYRAYIISQSGKNAFGYNEYIPRLESLRIEICLLNYAINHSGSLTNIMHVIKNNINTNDILAGDIFINNHNSMIIGYIDKHIKDFFDYLYLSDNELPYLHPGIPYTDTLMMGNNAFYIVVYNNGVKKWKEYDARMLRNDLIFFYPNDIILEGLYGKNFKSMIKS
jgi:hypothetical protein